MTKLLYSKRSKESVREDVHCCDSPYTQKRCSYIVIDSLCNAVFFYTLLFGQESKQGAESLEYIDEGRIREEKEDDE